MPKPARVGRIIKPGQEPFTRNKRCKICQAGSPLTEEITADILGGAIGAPAIVKKYKDRLKLGNTNIYSHKNHCNSEAVALARFAVKVQKQDPSGAAEDVKIKALVEMAGERKFELLELADACYREYIGDIAKINAILKELDDKKIEIDADPTSDENPWFIRKKILNVLSQKEKPLSALTGQVLSQFRTEKGVPNQQININMLQVNIGGLLDDVAQVLVANVPDSLTHTSGDALRSKVGAAFADAIEARFREILPIETPPDDNI